MASCCGCGQSLLGGGIGRHIEAVYVQSHLDAVDQLWPDLGREMGLMLKVLKQLEKDATIVTMQGLKLEVGNGEGDLSKRSGMFSRGGRESISAATE